MTATSPWFLAAERIIAGPPISIFSMQSSKLGAARHGFLKRIEIDHDQIDRLDVMRAHRFGMLGHCRG